MNIWTAKSLRVNTIRKERYDDHTWFAVVSTESFCCSLSRASHCQEFKYNTVPINLVLISIQYKTESHGANKNISKKLWKLTTHPEPCKAAPSALTFWINGSREPNWVSMAQPREAFGGSPPPSCHNISECNQRPEKRHRIKPILERLHKKQQQKNKNKNKQTYSNGCEILPENRVVYMTFCTGKE